MLKFQINLHMQE